MRVFQVLANAGVGQVNLLNKLTNKVKMQPMMSACPVVLAGFGSRFAHSQDITKNMQYISKEKKKLEFDPVTLKLHEPIERPLCIMINWMLARQKHIMKYAALHMEQGFDVLSVSCTPWQLMWPLKGSQLVALDLLKFVGENDHFDPLTVHGFSVAGYMWGEVCLIAQNNPKYMKVIDKVQSQIWDSAVDISEITLGVPLAIFPKNKVLQKALESYMTYHLKHFHSVATVHYMRSSQMFHRNLCKAPALFLLSKTDPVGAEHTNRKVHDSWVEMGTKTTWKCWDKSPHVQHFTKHREEYVSAVHDHLFSCGMMGEQMKEVRKTAAN